MWAVLRGALAWLLTLLGLFLATKFHRIMSSGAGAGKSRARGWWSFLRRLFQGRVCSSQAALPRLSPPPSRAQEAEPGELWHSQQGLGIPSFPSWLLQIPQAGMSPAQHPRALVPPRQSLDLLRSQILLPGLSYFSPRWGLWSQALEEILWNVRWEWPNPGKCGMHWAELCSLLPVEQCLHIPPEQELNLWAELSPWREFSSSWL